MGRLSTAVLLNTTALSVPDVERVNTRIDNVFGFEKHYIRGKQKMNPMYKFYVYSVV